LSITTHFGELSCHRQRFVNRDRATSDSFRVVLPGHELHREGVQVARLFESEDLRDVRMIQRGEGPGFALEASQSIGIVADGVREDFDGYLPTEGRVGRTIDFAHAARPDRSGDFVRADARAGGERQTLWIIEPRGLSRRRTGPASTGALSN
jgi:hypothetical protein